MLVHYFLAEVVSDCVCAMVSSSLHLRLVGGVISPFPLPSRRASREQQEQEVGPREPLRTLAIAQAICAIHTEGSELAHMSDGPG
jgi:hypothetical protein